MRILVVEDDPDIRETLALNLEDSGYRVATAGTAGEALQMVREEMPDLVLLDLMLPDRSGSEVCRALRANPRTARVAIIMVTARRGESDRVAGLEVGADDYVEKPFSMRELRLRIDAVMRRVQRLTLPPRIDSALASAREQIRVWSGFSANHFERGEWAECREICLALLRRHAAELTQAETDLLSDRLRRCEEQLRAALHV